MGSQGPQCHGGVKNSIFESFRFPAPKLALVPLVLRHRCIVYTSMWQFSSGLKEDEMGSQTPHYVRGCKKNIFDISRYLAPKLALVPDPPLCQRGVQKKIISIFLGILLPN